MPLLQGWPGGHSPCRCRANEGVLVCCRCRCCCHPFHQHWASRLAGEQPYCTLGIRRRTDENRNEVVCGRTCRKQLVYSVGVQSQQLRVSGEIFLRLPTLLLRRKQPPQLSERRAHKMESRAKGIHNTGTVLLAVVQVRYPIAALHCTLLLSPA